MVPSRLIGRTSVQPGGNEEIALVHEREALSTPGVFPALVACRDKLESNGVSAAELFDRPLFYSFRCNPAVRHSIKLQVTQFTK